MLSTTTTQPHMLGSGDQSSMKGPEFHMGAEFWQQEHYCTTPLPPNFWTPGKPHGPDDTALGVDLAHKLGIEHACPRTIQVSCSNRLMRECSSTPVDWKQPSLSSWTLAMKLQPHTSSHFKLPTKAPLQWASPTSIQLQSKFLSIPGSGK